MPKTSFSIDNAVRRGPKFNRLLLEQGEEARIVILDAEPYTEYVHSLNMPVLNRDNTPQMRLQPTSNGGEREVMVTEYVGGHLCFGDFDTVKQNAIDPDNCVTCRAARDEEGINPPRQYFAFNVFQYSVKAGGTQPVSPLSGEIKVWKITDTRWDKLLNIAEEVGDLRNVDLILGPCVAKQFQNFEMRPTTKSAWQANADTQKYVKTVYAENRTEDLTEAIGKRVSEDIALGDINRVIARYAQMNDQASAPVRSAQAQADVASILSAVKDDEDTATPAPEPVGVAASKVNSGSLDDFLAGLD